MNLEQIQFEIREGVGLITLNRPERMNAWTYRMSDELTHVIEQCNDDPEVGAMVKVRTPTSIATARATFYCLQPYSG